MSDEKGEKSVLGLCLSDFKSETRFGILTQIRRMWEGLRFLKFESWNVES